MNNKEDWALREVLQSYRLHVHGAHWIDDESAFAVLRPINRGVADLGALNALAAGLRTFEQVSGCTATLTVHPGESTPLVLLQTSPGAPRDILLKCLKETDEAAAGFHQAERMVESLLADEHHDNPDA